jgi:hypothetical protein
MIECMSCDRGSAIRIGVRYGCDSNFYIKYAIRLARNASLKS